MRLIMEKSYIYDFLIGRELRYWEVLAKIEKIYLKKKKGRSSSPSSTSPFKKYQELQGKFMKLQVFKLRNLKGSFWG